MSLSTGGKERWVNTQAGIKGGLAIGWTDRTRKLVIEN